MADVRDNIQALMNEVYDAWRKEENQGKGKWDVLENFSEAHQMAVVFGNFNYQVENGGIHQWIYNRYFHDDGEKLVGYLEAGAALDERCQTILDTLYKLDQCARDTDCNRDGYFIDPDDEDGEHQFIGDMINCDKFDSWYYEHCGKDDWWAAVGGVVEKVTGHSLVSVQPDESKIEEAPAPAAPPLPHPFSVHIQNAHTGKYSETAIPFPTDPAELRPVLDAIGVVDWQDIKNVEVSANAEGASQDESNLWRLTNKLNDVLYDAEMTPHTLNELNYLAARVQEVAARGEDGGIDIVLANIEAGKHCDTIAEMINLTFRENLNQFDCWPVYDAAAYGDMLVNYFKQDEHYEVYNRLTDSKDPADKAFAAHVAMLEKNIDYKAFGRATAKEEGGVFTEQGYLVGGSDANLVAIYRGPEDIPLENIVQPVYPDALRSLAKHIPVDADRGELTYLTAKLQGMDADQRAVFDAVMEAGIGRSSVAAIINITENLDCFNLQPTLGAEDYGMRRIEQDYDDGLAAYKRLEASDDPADRALAKHILTLNRAVNEEAYGHHVVNEEGNIFTKQGLLMVESEPRAVYHGVQDLPDEYRINEHQVKSPATDVPMANDDNDDISDDDGDVADTGAGALATPTIAAEKTAERITDRPSPPSTDSKPSVLAQIAEHREAQRKEPSSRDAPEPIKKKSDPEL